MENNIIVWNDVWKNQVEERLRIVPVDCGAIWKSNEAAEKFWIMTRKNQNDRTVKTLERLDLDQNSRVLDIGAGPGNLAIPFALKFAHVTAVEPADGMLNLLKKNAEKESIRNITCVQKKWEDFEIEKDLEAPCDLVIASFSLGMADIGNAIKKMIEASAKYVCLMWFAGETHWEKDYKKLWPKLHNEEYISSPKIDVLYNVLYQMGIYPELSSFPFSTENSFSSLEEALNHFKSGFKIKNEKQEKILLEYLEKSLEVINGKFVRKGSSTRVKVWWEI